MIRITENKVDEIDDKVKMKDGTEVRVNVTYYVDKPRDDKGKGEASLVVFIDGTPSYDVPRDFAFGINDVGNKIVKLASQSNDEGDFHSKMNRVRDASRIPDRHVGLYK